MPQFSGGAPVAVGPRPTAPNLTPIDPQASYDPEMAAELASRRGFTGDLKAGTGFAMDVLTTGLGDQQEAELQQAKQAALAQGIPFDEAAFRTKALQSRNRAMAEEKLGRERLVGESLAESRAAAGAQASERDVRLDTDLRRDVAENQLALEKFGHEASMYNAEASRAQQANAQLMSFYSQLVSGMMGGLDGFGAAASLGGNTYNYG